MIRRIYADLASFKNLEFRDGLNVLLADKSPGATDKQTRNGAGKSSLLDLIHFLLGSNLPPLLRNEVLFETRFGMEFDLAGQFTRVERTPKKASPLLVASDFSRWPITPMLRQGAHWIRNDDWKQVLGTRMFGLNEGDRWHPSFRSLISYFVRRDGDGGMEQPMKQSAMQQLVDQQVNISFLMGLDWHVAHQWQHVRERERSLEQLRDGLKQGAFGSVIGAAPQLKTDLIIAQDRVKRLRDGVASFRVLEQYHDLEKEASAITIRLGEIADENVLDGRYVAELERTTVAEVPPSNKDLELLYREAGVVLPALVKQRFDAVQAFHESVVRNRRSYLHGELESAKARMAERTGESSRLDARRAELMTLLRSAGALEHFTALQGELSRAEAEAEAIRQKFNTAQALETGELKLKVERAHLIERLRQDYVDEESVIEQSVLTFRRISARLYDEDKAGSLTITPDENGPKFEPHLPAEKSKGVNNMRIFCFDMMLTLLNRSRGKGPGFLVHDSHLFDGVDERQVGKALALGAELAKEHGFQYIVTMNSDDVPAEVPSGFNIKDHVIPVRLTDAVESGGLFGFRFE